MPRPSIDARRRLRSLRFRPDHPMVTESRQNLEGFCRERGLSIDAPAVITTNAGHQRPRNRREPGPPAPIAAQPLPPVPIPGRASHSFEWIATGAVVLVVAMLLVWRPWSSREASAPTPDAGRGATRRSCAAANCRTARQASSRSNRQGRRSAAPPVTRNVATGQAARHRRITVATAQLCRTFSTSGSTLALRSGGRLRDAGTDRSLHACQVPARCRSGASLVSRTTRCGNP